MADLDVDKLPPTQYLILEVLSARHRLGEQSWPFPNVLRPALNALAGHGLVNVDSHPTGWRRVSLTETGRRAAQLEHYASPTEQEQYPRLCCSTWDNTELEGLPHRCVIRLGWHIVHACHCGASRRVTDEEHVQIAHDLARTTAATKMTEMLPTANALIVHLDECEPDGKSWTRAEYHEATAKGGQMCPGTEYMRDELYPDEMVWIEAPGTTAPNPPEVPRA